MARRIAFFAAVLFFCGGAAADDPLAIGARVADWQLSHIGAPMPAQRPETYDTRGWVMGAFYVGLSAFAERVPRFRNAVIDAGKAEAWQLGPRPFHADDDVIAQSWIWAYRQAHDPRMIAPVRARFDAIIAAAPHGSFDFSEPKAGMEAACQDRWCWSDALFMGPPGWFELSRATGDPKYAAYADKEYWATVAALYSPDDHLFYRDTRFIGKKGPHGEKIFWARGNGWVYAGLARILQFLPADAPERPRYVALFRAMSEKLVAMQKPDGTWPVSLEGPPANTPPETSGTGFFTFGLAYGVASGLLAEPGYRAAARKGWDALTRAVEPDGKLGWVQPIGAAPDAVTRDDSAPFGVGAFLLAAAAVSDLSQQQQGSTTLSVISVRAYAESGINAVAVTRNALLTRGGYQYAAFYGAPRDDRVPVLVARRHGTGDWTVCDTGFAISRAAARDDHDVVAMAIDRNGVMHLSWGMHNVPLAYAVSRASVLGARFAVEFRRAPMIGRNEESVTYPEFLTAPDGTLLFLHRNGGSGRGNQYIDAYDAKARSWHRLADPMVDGISGDMNAYFNAFAFDPKGRLVACWTVRETPDWQTNHDLYCARSSDLGRHWAAFDGARLGATFDRAAGDAKAKILAIPAGSSLINQAGMAVDAAGAPVIATWWAPGGQTRQYMLVWKDGTRWRTAPISARPAGEARDGDGTRVRELARPVVLIGRSGTVYVVTRSTASSLVAADNVVRLYWSRDRIHWQSRVLSEDNPGAWEPVYDDALWRARHRLALLFQPVGMGMETSPIAVLTVAP